MASLNSHTQCTELYVVTAKHSFLKNPELKAITFSHLQFKELERGSLLNAALACKDFLDVALDGLWEKMDSLVPLLKLLPALQFKNKAYVLSGNVSQADWDRLQYYSRKIKWLRIYTSDPKVHPSNYFRIAQLQPESSPLFPSLRHLHCNLRETSISDSHMLFFQSPLLDSLELVNIKGFENTIVGPFLATLSSRMLSRIVLRYGQLSVDIFKSSIVHFKHLRSLELEDAVLTSDFAIWEVLGTLPSLVNFTLSTFEPASHPAHDPKNSNSQSEGPSPKYFEALECLSIRGSYFLIRHLLGFIDSPCLKSIEAYPSIGRVRKEHEHALEEELLTPSMAIVASKWSQSLKKLVIGFSRNAFSKGLMSLTLLHEMQTFHFVQMSIENMDDDVKRLVMSWPKLRNLNLRQIPISLSTLRLIAENCPELQYLKIHLDISTFPPFEASSKSLRHNLEDLTFEIAQPPQKLERQIQVARHLDLIFPSLKHVKSYDKSWYGIYDLVKLLQDTRLDHYLSEWIAHTNLSWVFKASKASNLNFRQPTENPRNWHQNIIQNGWVGMFCKLVDVFKLNGLYDLLTPSSLS